MGAMITPVHRIFVQIHEIIALIIPEGMGKFRMSVIDSGVDHRDHCPFPGITHAPGLGRTDMGIAHLHGRFRFIQELNLQFRDRIADIRIDGVDSGNAEQSKHFRFRDFQRKSGKEIIKLPSNFCFRNFSDYFRNYLLSRPA